MRLPKARPVLFSFLASFLIWLPGALSIVYTKYVMLTAARALNVGIVAGHASTALAELGPWQTLAVFRADLLLGWVVVPVCLLLLLAFLPRPVVTWLSAALALGTIVFLLPQAFIYRDVGTFLTLDFVTDAVHWGMTHPHDMRSYLGFKRGGALVLTLGTVIAGAVWAPRSTLLRGRPVHRLVSRGFVILATCLSPVAIVSWVVPVASPSPYHTGVVATVWTTLTQSGLPEFARLSPRDQNQLYRKMARAPLPAELPAHWGEAHGYDVVLFILETAPAHCLDLDGDLSDTPSLRRLRKTSWLAERHFTTFPYTNRATFSILSSQYPPDHTNQLFLETTVEIASLVRGVQTAGYQTAIYMPDQFWNTYEPRMYRALGIRNFRLGSERVAFAKEQNRSWGTPLERDRQALELLEHDASQWAKNRQRYLAVYLPQIGHEPWFDAADGKEKDACKLRRALSGHEDALLAELIATLEKEGRLDHTLIVVTGDHGARDRTSFADFGSALLEYEFHVPLLLYAPNIVNSTQHISWVTSHIDLAPSILDLLAIHEGRDYEQGSDLWDERLKDRTVYFWGNTMIGVDGYYSGNRFHVWNRRDNLVYVSQTTRLTDQDWVPDGASLHSEVTKTLLRMAGLRDARFKFGVRQTAAHVSAEVEAH